MEHSTTKGIVLVEKFYEDLELWYPYLRLKETGADMKIAGLERDVTYNSKHGYPAESEIGVNDVNPANLDILIIPGGYAPDHMRRHQAMVDIVRKAFDNSAVIGFICHGGWIAASAGIVNGKRCTSFFAIKDDMVNAGADWCDEEVVQDGNIISSRTPKDLPAFCSTIMQSV
mgnify:CR=1 FL=1